jgi:hypothetical protein
MRLKGSSDGLAGGLKGNSISSCFQICHIRWLPTRRLFRRIGTCNQWDNYSQNAHKFAVIGAVVIVESGNPVSASELSTSCKIHQGKNRCACSLEFEGSVGGCSNCCAAEDTRCHSLLELDGIGFFFCWVMKIVLFVLVVAYFTNLQFLESLPVSNYLSVHATVGKYQQHVQKWAKKVGGWTSDPMPIWGPFGKTQTRSVTKSCQGWSWRIWYGNWQLRPQNLHSILYGSTIPDQISGQCHMTHLSLNGQRGEAYRQGQVYLLGWWKAKTSLSTRIMKFCNALISLLESSLSQAGNFNWKSATVPNTRQASSLPVVLAGLHQGGDFGF